MIIWFYIKLTVFGTVHSAVVQTRLFIEVGGVNKEGRCSTKIRREEERKENKKILEVERGRSQPFLKSP